MAYDYHEKPKMLPNLEDNQTMTFETAFSIRENNLHLTGFLQSNS